MFDGMNINDVSAKNAFAILGYLPKVCEYFGIVWDMCKYDNRVFFTVWKHVLQEKKNVTLKLTKEFSTHLIGDYIFTMGEYWDDYYLTEHGYKKEQIRLIGDHDLDGFVPTGKNEDAICYIANVLVEDGTVTKKDFDAFLHAFAESVDKKTKLYIKLHPRSNNDLYDIFKDHNGKYHDEAMECRQILHMDDPEQDDPKTTLIYAKQDQTDIQREHMRAFT